MLKNVNNNNDFRKLVLESDKLVLVDFFAAWCSPCKKLSVELEKLSNSRSNFDIVKVNLDELKDLAVKYNITAIPTMIIFKNGEAIDKIMGVEDSETIMKFVLENSN